MDQETPAPAAPPVRPSAQDTTPVTFTTPSGDVVELKPFMTGYDDDEVRAAMFDDMSIDAEIGKEMEGQKMKMPMSLMLKARQKKLEIMVLSVNGNTEDPYDLVQSMNVKDRDSVRDKIEEIAPTLDTKEKKKSSTSTTASSEDSPAPE